MGLDSGMVIAGVAYLVGSIVWAVRQEGRINMHEKQHENHEKRHDEIARDISYIRERIDRALNGHS